MKCLLCPLVFYTFRQLVSHCDEAHGLAAAVNRDQLWKNHRLLVTKDSRLLSPKPIVSLKVPKDLLGCPELHLALVHKDTDLEVGGAGGGSGGSSSSRHWVDRKKKSI